MIKKNLGFTILELLVVVAIIGILSSVILISLDNTRSKSKIASIQESLGSVVPLAITCLDDGSQLTPMTDSSGGGVLCSSTVSEWPELVSGWSYDINPTSNVNTNTFSFGASDQKGNSVICSDSEGCVTTLEE